MTGSHLEGWAAVCDEEEVSVDDAELEVDVDAPDIWKQEWWQDGRIIVFTDGACRNNQDDRFRRAGAGAFYGRNSPYKVASKQTREQNCWRW